MIGYPTPIDSPAFRPCWQSQCALACILAAALLAPSAALGPATASPLPRGDGTVESERDNDPPGDADLLLETERWHEYAYGLSFRPPRDARISPVTSGDGVARIQSQRLQCLILLSFERTEDESSVAELAQASIRYMIGQPQARVTDQRILTVGDLPAAKVYYLVPRPGQTPAIRAHAIVQIDPRTYALFQLDHDRDAEGGERLELVKRTFNAMVHSVRATAPGELERQREAMMAAGESFRQSALGIDRLRERLEGQRYYRIRHGRNDVGFMLIHSDAEGRMMGIDGITMVVEARVALSAAQVLDSRAVYFLSQDRQTEYWDVTQTFRPADRATRQRLRQRGYSAPEGGANPTEHLAINDQGLRSLDVITVTRSTAGWNRGVWKQESPEHRAWQVPRRGYISQIERELLGGLLPRDEDLPHAFYCYHPTSGRLLLRTERAEKHEDGTFSVYSRISLDQPEFRSVYDRHGRLLRRELPRNMELTLSTRKELSDLWPLPEEGQAIPEPQQPEQLPQPQRPPQPRAPRQR